MLLYLEYVDLSDYIFYVDAYYNFTAQEYNYIEKLAKKSKKIGKPVELEPMTSIERKIIHNALTGIKNVETESRGEEPHRYLVITAK